MSTNNYILPKQTYVSMTGGFGTIYATENIDGNRFAVGGRFDSIIDSTGVNKAARMWGVLNKDGELTMTDPVYEGATVRALAYLGNNLLAIASDNIDAPPGSPAADSSMESKCVIFDITPGQTPTVKHIFNTDDRIFALANLEGGKFAMGGDFQAISADTLSPAPFDEDSFYCAILNANGTFDISLNFGARVNTLAYLGENSLAVGGEFDAFTDAKNGKLYSAPYFAYIGTDGVFLNSISFNNHVNAIAVLPDKKLAIGGMFTEVQPPPDADGIIITLFGLNIAIFAVRGGNHLGFLKGFNCTATGGRTSSVNALAYLGNNKLAVGGSIDGIASAESLLSTTELAVINVDNDEIVKTFSNIKHLYGVGAPVLGLADLSNNYLVVGGVFTNMHNDCPGATGGSESVGLAILNNIESVLKPTVQKPTEPVAHLSVTVPTPQDEGFTEHPSDTSARNQAKANGQQTYYYAKGKYLCKKPEFCLDIEKRGFNNFKLSRK